MHQQRTASTPGIVTFMALMLVGFLAAKASTSFDWSVFGTFAGCASVALVLGLGFQAVIDTLNKKG